MVKYLDWLKEVPFAHRGYYNDMFPENSMGAFRNAIKYGYGIELDVQYTKDKKVVVFHDDNLKRMTGNENNVDELTYAQINKLTLLDSNERIPLLKDVLNTIDKRVPLLIEIKKTKEYISLSKDVNNITKDYRGNYSIQSFDPRIVKWYKDNAKDVLRGQITCSFEDELLKWYEKLVLKNMLLNFTTKPDYIAHGLKGIKSSRVALLRKKIPILCWTIKNEEDMKKAYKYCDNIIFEGF
ncbi:MAG: glycerophosphodiester phosphodiesterase family protein [Romboutsia sp.]|uniref:glycerophosphodiester phosphodiesterase family protein n=1 Tax=Romboutsia sp. TaxID=1965302 RepID=UPI003F3375BD